MTAQRMSLAEAAAANIQTGVLLLCKEALVTAIQDRRLERRHLRILATMVSFMNTSRARAWPSRLQIAYMTGLSCKTISNILVELRTMGYLMADKEVVPEAGDKRLTVYTFGNIDHETIRKHITEWVMHLRERETPESSLQAGNSEPLPTEKIPVDKDLGLPATGKFPAGRELGAPVDRKSSLQAGNSEPPSTEKVPVDKDLGVPADQARPSRARADNITTTTSNNNNNSLSHFSNFALTAEPAADAAAESADQPGSPKKRRSQIDPGWQPAEKDALWVKSLWVASEPQIAEQRDQFVDHHRSKGSLMVDWTAAWRTWWRSGYHKIPRRAGSGSPSKGVPEHGLAEVYARMRAEEDADAHRL